MGAGDAGQFNRAPRSGRQVIREAQFRGGVDDRRGPGGGNHLNELYVGRQRRGGRALTTRDSLAREWWVGAARSHPRGDIIAQSFGVGPGRVTRGVDVAGNGAPADLPEASRLGRRSRLIGHPDRPGPLPLFTAMMRTNWPVPPGRRWTQPSPETATWALKPTPSSRRPCREMSTEVLCRRGDRRRPTAVNAAVDLEVEPFAEKYGRHALGIRCTTQRRSVSRLGQLTGIHHSPFAPGRRRRGHRSLAAHSARLICPRGTSPSADWRSASSPASASPPHPARAAP